MSLEGPFFFVLFWFKRILIAQVSGNTLYLKFKLFVVLKTVETLGNRCPSYSPYQQCPGLVQDECSCHADCDEANKYMCCFDGCRRRCRLTNATNASMYLNGLNLECGFFFQDRSTPGNLSSVGCFWIVPRFCNVFSCFRMLPYTLTWCYYSCIESLFAWFADSLEHMGGLFLYSSLLRERSVRLRCSSFSAPQIKPLMKLDI